MKCKLATTLLLSLLAAPAYAQTSVTERFMNSSNTTEGTTLRTTGFYGTDKYKFFGEFSASDGIKKDYFGILSAHRELPKGFELVVEIEKGRNSRPVTGAGIGYDMQFKDGRLALHFIPVRVAGGSLERGAEVAAFGGRKMGKYYVEGRAGVSVPYDGFRGELCLGKNIGGRLSAEVHVARNGYGNTVRGGMMYKIK